MDIPFPAPAVGHDPIDAGIVAAIVKSRAEAVGFHTAVLGGLTLKGGDMTTNMTASFNPLG